MSVNRASFEDKIMYFMIIPLEKDEKKNINDNKKLRTPFKGSRTPD